MNRFTRLISVVVFALGAGAAEADIDQLDLYIRTNFPPEVVTVEDAANFLLESTDYALVLSAPAPEEAPEMAKGPLSPMTRLPRTMTITDALLVLIGPENWLIVDRKNKLVSFARSPE